MQEAKLTVTLYRCGGIQQRQRVDELLWLSDYFDVGVDRPMITPPVRFVSIILLYGHGAARVVLDEDAVSIRRTLIVLVFESILSLFPLISRHESDFLLLVAREVTLVNLCVV